MTFKPNIPNPNDFLSASQPVIKANFQALDNVFFKNHFKFSDGGGNAGKHRFVELVQGGLPAGLVSGKGTLYTKNVGSNVQLFFTPGASGNEIQLTTKLSSSQPVPVAASSGFSFLPGGIFIIWADAGAVNNNTVITFPFGGFNNVFSVAFSLAKSSTGAEGMWIESGSLTASGFKFKTSAGSGQFTHLYYIAIGN